jgi:hypothetical protein
MADLFQWFGNDLVAASNGDLQVIEGTVKGEQAVVRRLMTPVLSYIWEPGYGAGLGQYIGNAASAAAIQGVIRSQLYLEASVSQNPTPTISVTPISNGFNVVIQYVDAQTGAPAVLNFSVTPPDDNS